MISRRVITFFLLSLLSPLGLASSRRKSYKESCLLLQKIGQLEPDQFPEMPDHRPRYEDPEPLGVSFFRTVIEDEKLANLTLPRTFFSRSEIRNVSFANTDFSESTLCWNDFIDVDFSKAILRNLICVLQCM
jgi:Pentapeptide repeats (8 copies)